MWVTYIVWAIAVSLGIAVYYIWYVQQPEPVAVAEPVPTAVVEPIVGEDNATIANQPPPPQNITLVNFEFNPGEITVPTGTQVIWTSRDNAPHNITFVDGSFETEDFFAGESAEFTFTDPGSYVIYCTIHGEPDGTDMASIVTVVEQPPDAEPIAAVTAVPTIAPTEEPTAVPTDTPTPEPTEEPVEAVAYDTSFITNAAAQMAIAREHAALMLSAFNGGDLETTRREAEQVLNVIEGKSDDHNDDDITEDPSDGIGLLAHLQDAKEQAESADLAPEAEANNAIVLETLNYAIDQVKLASNEGATVVEAPARGDVEALVRMLTEADETGGLQEALAASLQVAGPTAVVDVAPTAEPTPEPVVLTINMEDFEFVSNNVTIKRGTTVTWVNVGDKRHSAQADDGTFNTTLINSGEVRSFTFDAPGSFAYFCELHGESGGGGMSGVIVVEE
jgi:plastocyanin